ncbi:hypothetical protein GCM10010522_62670 [Kribbella solani]
MLGVLLRCGAVRLWLGIRELLRRRLLARAVAAAPVRCGWSVVMLITGPLLRLITPAVRREVL